MSGYTIDYSVVSVVDGRTRTNDRLTISTNRVKYSPMLLLSNPGERKMDFDMKEKRVLSKKRTEKKTRFFFVLTNNIYHYNRLLKNKL